MAVCKAALVLATAVTVAADVVFNVIWARAGPAVAKNKLAATSTPIRGVRA
jgi:hypothetical protein